MNEKHTLLDPDEILVDSVSVLAGSGDYFERQLERPLSRVLPLLAAVCIGLGYLFLLGNASRLQLYSGARFFRESQKNRFAVRATFPPRGILFDRRGVPLVENTPEFSAIFDKEAFLKKGGMALEELIARMSELLGKDEVSFFDAGINEDYNLGLTSSRVFLAHDLSRDEVIMLGARRDELPGVEVVESYRRVYRDPFAYAHLVGFVGKVGEADIRERPTLRGEESVGKSGIEAQYDAIVRGAGGKRIIEVDSKGVDSHVRFSIEPKQGAALWLALDSGLQEIIYSLLENYTEARRGASVVALDPRDGAVRALVSFPGFDATRLGGAGLSANEFEAIVKNPLKPFFNRAIGGEFPSGSTIKPFIAAAALSEQVIDPAKKIYDPGFLEIPNPYKPGETTVFKDWRAHGWVDFYDAIALSANVYFYIIGGGYRNQQGLGIERIKDSLERFGLGATLGIDLPGEKSGLIPDPAIKAQLEPLDPVWRIGDTYNVSIGQGGVKVTPIQMAAATAALANGGTLYEPRVVEEVLLNEKGGYAEKRLPIRIREEVVPRESIDEVVKGMRQAVTSGTARLLQEVPAAVAAKTGTAQAGSGLPHAWVTAFAPVENPEIVLVVMVEHAGEGATVAVPITNEILKWYFLHQ